MQHFFKRGRHYRNPPLWKRILIWTAISLLAIILVIGLAGFIFVYHTLGKIGQDEGLISEARQQLDVPLPDEPMNILVLGADEDPDGTAKRSDTMMLVRVNPDDDYISIISIPRDLITDIPGYGQDKINTAYAVGGVSLAIDTVRDLTDQPVHHFALIDYHGFEQAVDALGGVYVDVDRRYFNDNSDALWGDAYEPIDLWPGYQRLKGSDALAYVRYRHTDNDFMRIARQQYFISDVKSQSMNWSNVSMIPGLADVFASNTTSDIGRSDILSLTRFILGIDRGRIYQAQVPVLERLGGPAGSYIALDKKEFPRVLEDFTSPSFDMPAAGEQEASGPRDISAATRLASIEVSNGNGVDGDAARAAELLKGNGFTSVTVGGNAPKTFHENQIYFTDGNQTAADEMCKLLEPCLSKAATDVTDTSAQLLLIVGTAFAAEPEQVAPEAGAVAPKPPLQFVDISEYDADQWDEAALEVSFRAWRPGVFPVDYGLLDFHAYDIETEDGIKPALKAVCQNEEGHYWGIMETTFTDAPLLQKPSMEKEVSGKNLKFYYAGGHLRYLAWQEQDVVIWITNSLQSSLSEETMVKLALSFEPV